MQIDAKTARNALAAIRLVNGTAALVAPRLFARRLGIDPATSPAAPYLLRLFGVRTIVIGLDLVLLDNEGKHQAGQAALGAHASDLLAAVVAGMAGQLPRRAAITAAGISSLNLALAAAAQRE